MIGMQRGDFEQLVERVRASHPIWFDLDPDAPMDEARRRDIESALGARLPADYAWFLAKFGGGDFAFARTYSGDERSDLYLLSHQDGVPDDAVAFADDGTGNWFVFPVVDGVCEDTVRMHDHETGETRATDDDGFLGWLRRVGLRADA